MLCLGSRDTKSLQVIAEFSRIGVIGATPAMANPSLQQTAFGSRRIQTLAITVLTSACVMPENTQPSTLTLSGWLQHARGPYLNFLRNLTPQVLIASLAWVLASKLNFAKFDLANFVPTFGFFAFLLLFGYAAYSNISLFLSDLFPSLMPWVREQEKALQNAGVSGWRVPKSFILAVLKERKLEVALAAFALVMLQFVFAGVLAASIVAAVNLIRATHA
jgi:hypothetical protein